MTNLTWKIDNLDRSIDDGVVKTACWRIIAEDQGAKAQRVGYVNFGPAGSPFIPYEALTEEQVVVWVKEAMRGVRVIGTDDEGNEIEVPYDEAAEQEAACEKDLNDLLNPVTKYGVPWETDSAQLED